MTEAVKFKVIIPKKKRLDQKDRAKLVAYWQGVYDRGERELVIDNFAGGGGASTGIEGATGVSVDVAINHDPAAIAMHKATILKQNIIVNRSGTLFPGVSQRAGLSVSCSSPPIASISPRQRAESR